MCVCVCVCVCVCAVGKHLRMFYLTSQLKPGHPLHRGPINGQPVVMLYKAVAARIELRFHKLGNNKGVLAHKTALDTPSTRLRWTRPAQDCAGHYELGTKTEAHDPLCVQ